MSLTAHVDHDERHDPDCPICERADELAIKAHDATGTNARAVLEYVVKTTCPLCDRREGDVPALMEGVLVYVCETCWNRIDEPDEDEPEFDREGQPEFNGAFR